MGVGSSTIFGAWALGVRFPNNFGDWELGVASQTKNILAIFTNRFKS